VRTRNLLWKNGIQTAEEADAMSVDDLLEIPDIGEATVLDLAATLRLEGFTDLFSRTYWRFREDIVLDLYCFKAKNQEWRRLMEWRFEKLEAEQCSAMRAANPPATPSS